MEEEETFYSDYPADGQEKDYGRNFDENSEENLRAMLEQKERDLMLAAELGKALLDKNTELEKRLEQTIEEYNQHIEVNIVSTVINHEDILFIKVKHSRNAIIKIHVIDNKVNIMR